MLVVRSRSPREKVLVLPCGGAQQHRLFGYPDLQALQSSVNGKKAQQFDVCLYATAAQQVLAHVHHQHALEYTGDCKGCMHDIAQKHMHHSYAHHEGCDCGIPVNIAPAKVTVLDLVV
jgi:site-specific recombinase XerC